MSLRGKIVEILANFYYVRDDENKVWECFARARLLKEGKLLFVGDEVEIEKTSSSQSVIVNLLPRRNSIQKPPIANVNQFFVVFSSLEPDFDHYNLDRYLSYIRYKQSEVGITICINKIDLKKMNISEEYENSGFKIFYISAKTCEGLSLIFNEIADKTTVLTGPSGVGKSSLIKALSPNEDIKIGALSAIKTGKHITRNVKLISICCDGRKGYIADTPGFTNISFIGLNESRLLGTFSELKAVQCMYGNCLHSGEEGCLINEAINSGLVSRLRYESYTRILSESRLETVYSTKVESKVKEVGGRNKKLIPKISYEKRAKSRKKEKQELQRIKIEKEENKFEEP